MSEKPDTTNNDSGILRPIYYQPGKLIFHVHGELLPGSAIVDELMIWASEVADKHWSKPSSIKISTPNTEKDVFGFNPMDILSRKKKSPPYVKKAAPNVSHTGNIPGPGGNQRLYQSPAKELPPPFSLIFADVYCEEWPPEFLTDSRHRGSKEERKVQAKALDELLDLAILLDNRRGEAPVKLEVVSPNWLYSGGSFEDPGTTGGPGGRPSPVHDPDTGKYHIAPILNLFPDSSQVRNLGIGIKGNNLGTGVVVAILDTSYKEDELEDILDTWVHNKPNDPHPIIRKLLSKVPQELGALRNADRTLRVHTDQAVTDYMPDLRIDGHDYDMTDHGLFVAGIINTIAPKAELHLYQVLNHHGLGDLSFIAGALDEVLNNYLNNPLVINLSLTMNMPLEEGHLKAEDDLGVGRTILERRPWWLVPKDSKLFNWLIKWLIKLPWFRNSWFQRQAHPFEWICDLIYELDSRVIAAAGNYAKNRNQRPRALYPAAFDRVLGVGALEKDDGSVVAASYSNLADEPTKVGITAFGGEPEEKEILGVYVGDFPKDDTGHRPPNTNGWAWWSGTSFATPVISGSTAAVLGVLPSGETTEDAIKELFEAQGLTTNKGEDVFTIVQG